MRTATFGVALRRRAHWVLVVVVALVASLAGAGVAPGVAGAASSGALIVDLGATFGLTHVSAISPNGRYLVGSIGGRVVVDTCGSAPAGCVPRVVATPSGFLAEQVNDSGVTAGIENPNSAGAGQIAYWAPGETSVHVAPITTANAPVGGFWPYGLVSLTIDVHGNIATDSNCPDSLAVDRPECDQVFGIAVVYSPSTNTVHQITPPGGDPDAATGDNPQSGVGDGPEPATFSTELSPGGTLVGMYVPDASPGGASGLYAGSVSPTGVPNLGATSTAATTHPNMGRSRAVNDAGTVVGDSLLDLNIDGSAAWKATGIGAAVELGSLGGPTAAVAINQSGVIAGDSYDKPPNVAGGVDHAVVWAPNATTPTPVDSLLPSGSGWTTSTAVGVDAAGDIIGTGTHNGAAALFLYRAPAARHITGSISQNGTGVGAVTVAATPTGGGGAVTTFSDATGAYSLDVPAGTYTVTLTGLPAGTSSNPTFANVDVTNTDATANFSLASGPQVTNVDPPGGSLRGGTIVHITGQGFDAPNTSVKFVYSLDQNVANIPGDHVAPLPASVHVDSATQITITTADTIQRCAGWAVGGSYCGHGAGPPLTHVEVCNDNGCSDLTPSSQYTWDQPFIDHVAPDHGPINGGTTVDVVGRGLNDVGRITFNVNIPNPSFPGTVGFGTETGTNLIHVSDSELTVTVPSDGTDGPAYWDLLFNTPPAVHPGRIDGTVSAQMLNADQVAFDSAGAWNAHPVAFGFDEITVTGSTPDHGPAGGGTVMQVTGANFSGPMSVLFPTPNAAQTGTRVANPVTVASSNLLQATTPDLSRDLVPPAPGDGASVAYEVCATNDCVSDSTRTFTFDPPSIQGLSRTTVGISGGPPLVITGTGFRGTTALILDTNGRGAGPLITGYTTAPDGTSITLPSIPDLQAFLPAGQQQMNVEVEVRVGNFASSPTAFAGRLTINANTSPGCGTLQNCQGATNTDPNGTAVATSSAPTGTVTATARGVGGITVGRYPSSPVGPPTFHASGAYFDVRVSNPNQFSTATIQDCDLQGGTTVRWWNPAAGNGTGAWQPVSSTTYSPGPPGCLTVTVTPTSSPNLAQLTGTIFAVERADWASLQFTGGLTYNNAGSASSGDLRLVSHGTGPVRTLTGQITIPGAQGGTATVTVVLVPLYGWYAGAVRVTDPGAHLDQITPILTQAVSRVGLNGAQVTSSWSTVRNGRLAKYTLHWTIIDTA